MYSDKHSLKIALLKLAERPGIFIGKNRFDYLQVFYSGWDYPNWDNPSNDKFSWMSDYDIQRWLFLRESASIAHAATVTGWSLLQRCYGNRQLALNHFKTMLEEIELSDGKEYRLDDTVAWHIYQIYSLYHWNSGDRGRTFNAEVSSEYYPASDNIRKIIGKVQNSYDSIIPHVTRMIMEPYNDLWVYLHYERYFLQVRFLYHSKDRGWVDNTSLTAQEDYYRDLTILHAYVSLLQKEEHPNHNITLHSHNGMTEIEVSEIKDVWYDILNEDFDISASDDAPLCKSYYEWKKSVGNS